MFTPDVINGLFEAFGTLFVAKSVYQLYKDKEVKGISKLTMTFFTSWGYWNLYYYPSLDQWFSFVAGACLAFTNTIWVGQMLYYSYWWKKPDPLYKQLYGLQNAGLAHRQSTWLKTLVYLVQFQGPAPNLKETT